MRRYSIMIFPALLSIPAWGFDPRAVDIVSYRLGMTHERVLGLLKSQGYNDPPPRLRDTDCIDAPGTRCVTMIEARTKDGTLLIHFTPPTRAAAVTEIAYTLDARRPGEPEAVEQAVLDRYGTPTSANPMTWCDRPPGGGPCAPHEPRLSFRHGVGVARILTLTQGSR